MLTQALVTVARHVNPLWCPVASPPSFLEDESVRTDVRGDYNWTVDTGRRRRFQHYIHQLAVTCRHVTAEKKINRCFRLDSEKIWAYLEMVIGIVFRHTLVALYLR